MTTPHKSNNLDKLIDHLFRQEYGKIVSYLTAIFGLAKLQSMEDIAQETLLEAYKNWSYHGIPPAPERWIFKVAKNKAINFSIREKKKNKIYSELNKDLANIQQDELYSDEEISDSMLRMIFACATPELTDTNKVLLILNTLCGFTRTEIAQSLLVEEEAVKKRLFRSKKILRELNHKFQVPAGERLLQRLHTVLTALYLVFNQGYNSSSKNELIRQDVCLEAIRLTKLVVKKFKNEVKPKALLALMCFHAARFASRIDNKGAIVLMKNQNRKLWDRELIKLGVYYLANASKGTELSVYHIEAAIAAEHCKAKNFDVTNWSRIQTLYEQLYELKPTPVIQINQAIVQSKLGYIDLAICNLKALESIHPEMKKYYLFHATLGELFTQKGNQQSAVYHFNIAITNTNSETEKALLLEKIKILI